MTMERVALLDELGFSWEVRPSLERPRATWQQRLEELTEFHNKTSTTSTSSASATSLPPNAAGNAATATAATNSPNKQRRHFLLDPSCMPQLHAWAHEQKQRLKLLEKNNGKDVSKRMGPERVDALNKLGFDKNVELNDNEPYAVQVEEVGTGTGTMDDATTNKATSKKAKQNKPIKDGDKKKAAKDTDTDQKKEDSQGKTTTDADATATPGNDHNNSKEGVVGQQTSKDTAAAEAVVEEGDDEDKLYTTIEV
jgi:hypothetical protein